MTPNPGLPCLVNDFGGHLADPVVFADHELAPWEKRTHTTLECLYWRGAMSMEEKRNAVEGLGELVAFLVSDRASAIVGADHGGTVELRYDFTLDGDLISRLVIAP